MIRRLLVGLVLGAMLVTQAAAMDSSEPLTPELVAIEQMRAAVKASGDPNFLGDPGFYLTDSDHSSASNPVTGAACFDERYLYFWYRLPATVDTQGAIPSIAMRHRMVRDDAPPFCVGSGGELTAREDLWDATSYWNVSSCHNAAPERCSFHAWVPIPGAPPPPAPPVLPPESKPRPWYCREYEGWLNEHGIPIFGC